VKTWDRANTEHTLGTLDPRDLRSLIEKSRDGNWREVLRRSENLGLQRKRNWFENRRKGLFYLNLGCPPGGSALDIGAGSGIVSEVLADYYRTVYALDYNEDFIEFLKLRFIQGGKRNVRVVRGNALELPLRDCSLDLAVLNGVLEWTPSFRPANDPYATQQEALRECFRVLRPGGKIAIAIENRYYLHFLRGSTPHGDYPFTTVLPRALANWLNLRVRGAPYRNYIHSSVGYRRLLESAAFRSIERYVILPDYHNPLLVVGFQDNRMFARALSSGEFLSESPIKRMIRHALGRVGLAKHLVHSFYVVGTRP